MNMRQELSEVLRAAPPHASVMVGADRWDVHVFGVTRVGRDIFMQLALVGPRTCTVTVRAPAPIGNPATARRLLTAVREWIVLRGDADQAYLELVEAAELAS